MGSTYRDAKPKTEPQLSVSAEVDTQFSAGLAAGLDPDASHSNQPSSGDEPQQVTTTLRSRWLHRLCPVCKHIFRLGDDVLLLPDGKAIHDMPGLRCSNAELKSEADADAEAAVNRVFFEGIAHAWPMPDDVPILHLEGDHELLAPAKGGFSRTSCRVCGHSFRPGDRVVICPCNPDQPRCRVAVHRDILKQLHCWDQWQKSDARGECLAMT